MAWPKAKKALSTRQKKARGKPFKKGEMPPVGKQWQPGECGNPVGVTRSVGELEVRELARAEGSWVIGRLRFLAETSQGMTAVNACNSILDRAYGKPREFQDVNVNFNAELRGMTDEQLEAAMQNELARLRESKAMLAAKVIEVVHPQPVEPAPPADAV